MTAGASLNSHTRLLVHSFCRDYVEHFDSSPRILKDLQESMADNGVIVASTGFALVSDSPALQMKVAKGFVDALIEAGFASVRDYEEVRTFPWEYSIVMSDCKHI
jgi:hypothetical protein